MPLKLVLGPANSAKAGEVLGAYTLASQRDALLVVPTTADVAYYDRELASPGVTLGHALTFPALIDEIAQRARFQARRLTSLQRERLVRRTIANQTLPTLAASAESPGFARAAGRLFAELRQQRVTPARFGSALKAWAAGGRERTFYSSDLAMLYRRYVSAVERSGRVDAETFSWAALDALRARPTRWGSTPVFFYGFDDFTPVELDAIETLARMANAQVTVSLTYEPDRPALAARASVVEELRSVASTTTQLPPLDQYYVPRSRTALHHLERNLFQPDPPSIEPGTAVTLLEAGGERAEAELLAAELLSALGDGVPAAEVVVVCRSLGRSAELLERTFARHGVHATSARQLPLSHTALGRALLALVRTAWLPAAERTHADLLAYLRHPGIVEPIDAVDRLEADIRRTGTPNAAAMRARGPALRPALNQIEELRQSRDAVQALPSHVQRLLVAPHRGGAPLLTASQQLDARAAKVVLEALAQVGDLDDGRPLPMPELVELLEGLQVPAHGLPAADAVLIAEPLAIRARRFRRVFVAGLCEGEFPGAQAAAGDPFLSDDRRHELALASELALPQTTDPLDRERYFFYACVSRATEQVTFSYRSSDEDGNRVASSPFLDDVAELFPPEWRANRRRRLLADVVWSVDQAPTERERRLAEVHAASSASPQTAATGNGHPTGGRARGNGHAPASPADMTRALSARAMTHVRHRDVISASALEVFAACPVKWLIERQLRARDLEPEPEAITRGTVMHSVLEQVISRLEGRLDVDSLPTAEAGLREAVTRAGTAVAVGQSTPVRTAILRGMEEELLRYLRHEAQEDSLWEPLHTEVRFGLDDGDQQTLPAVQLGDAPDSVLLSGVIDRIDVDRDDGRYVVVRDYKSGVRNESWPSARWLFDNQLQVGLYMIAVRRLLGLEPVAGFYQPLSGPDLRARGVYEGDSDTGQYAVYTDELSKTDLNELLDEIEEQAVAVAAVLRSGELTPCPQTCTTAGTCSHPGICWSR